jgi:hypothetical protein
MFAANQLRVTVCPFVHGPAELSARSSRDLEKELNISRIPHLGFAVGFGRAPWVIVLMLVIFPALRAFAQGASAQLSVNLTVQSSISLVFQNNPSVGSVGFCPLTNAGTNNVGLVLGVASFTGGATLSCVNYSHIGSATYEVSTAFDVLVTKANSSSPNYRLAASLSSAPPANASWLINNTTLGTSLTTFQTTNAYSTPVTETLKVQVKNSVPAQILQETITFLATAN